MAKPARIQLTAFFLLLALNVILVFVSVAFLPAEQLIPVEMAEASLPDVPPWVLGLANAGMVLVAYGLMGLAGLWFARRLGIPGIFHPKAGWRRWVVIPMAIGVAVGILMIVVDQLFASMGDWSGFMHPPFPLSLLASATAGIGEEITFRVFVMGLWAFLLNLVLRRWGTTRAAIWIGNVIASLAFAAAHLPATMFLLGATTPLDIPPLVLSEIFLLNGLLGLVAGERYARDGLVAAAGVHFCADIIWHVIWPLL